MLRREPMWQKFSTKNYVFNLIKIKNKKEINRKKWILESFDIEKLPERIDFHSTPTPSGFSHKILLKFWKTKAKICKPYEK